MIDYKNPHQVMLFFEQKKHDDQTISGDCFMQQQRYYEQLKADGKVAISGNLYNQGKMFVILSVSCDTELEEIINNDPGVQQNTAELIKAMPFVAV